MDMAHPTHLGAFDGATTILGGWILIKGQLKDFFVTLEPHQSNEHCIHFVEFCSGATKIILQNKGLHATREIQQMT